MTWVVGASSFLGYGVMISDVRITFSDGDQSDMLRKVYPVGPWMLAGFAGSVKIGLALIDNLRRSLTSAIPPEAPEGCGFVFNPDTVAEEWSPQATEIYRSMPEQERSLGCQILLVGVNDPPPERALAHNERQLPRVHIIELSCPNFVPQPSQERWTAKHIGSGSDIEVFVKSIEGLFDIKSGTLNFEAVPGGWSAMLGRSVGLIVQKYPVDGIGALVNIDTCEIGNMYHGNNNHQIFSKDGTVINFEMPIIAESYEQFLSMCQDRGRAAAGALA